MRATRDLSFPHPVIGNGDDAAGSFEPTLKRTNDRKQLILELGSLDTSNPAVASYIEKGLARYAVRVESASSGYRATFMASKNTMKITIPLAELYQEVEVEAGVIAYEPIPAYRPTEPHADYGDATFELEPGDVIAVGPGWRFEITSEWDPLKAPMPSIMRIEAGEFEHGAMEAVLETPKISVRVSKQDFQRYLTRKHDSADVLHATIVFPVLIHALSKIEADEYKDNLWAVRLRELLNIGGIDPEDPLRAAQLLLKLPLSRGLTRLEELLQATSDE